MQDWDNSGKKDHNDSTLFHTEIDNSSNNNNNTLNDDGGKYAVWIANVFSILWLFILFNFDVPINTLTAILTLISVCCLGWSLFVLFINATSR